MPPKYQLFFDYVRKIFVFLIFPFLLLSCSGGDNNINATDTNGGDNKSSTSLLLININDTNPNDVGLIVASDAGDTLYVAGSRDINGQLNQSKYVVHKNNSYGYETKVFLSATGLPTLAIIDQITYRFLNYRLDQNLVDIVVNYNDGRKDVFNDIPMPDNLQSFNAPTIAPSNALKLQVSGQISYKSQTAGSALSDVSGALSNAMIGVKIVGCAVGAISASTGVGFLAAAALCGLAIDDIKNYINNGYTEPGITDYVTCPMGDLIACVEAVGDLGSKYLSVLDKHLTTIRDNIDEINDALDKLITFEERWETFHPGQPYSEANDTPPLITINSPYMWATPIQVISDGDLYIDVRIEDDVEVIGNRYTITNIDDGTITAVGSFDMTPPLQTNFSKNIDVSSWKDGIYEIKVFARDGVYILGEINNFAQFRLNKDLEDGTEIHSITVTGLHPSSLTVWGPEPGVGPKIALNYDKHQIVKLPKFYKAGSVLTDIQIDLDVTGSVSHSSTGGTQLYDRGASYAGPEGLTFYTPGGNLFVEDGLNVGPGSFAKTLTNIPICKYESGNSACSVSSALESLQGTMPNETIDLVSANGTRLFNLERYDSTSSSMSATWTITYFYSTSP